MITLKVAQFFISLLTGFIAYCLVTTFAGSFQAWVAKKMGDDTAEEAGFMSLNPADHWDLFGLLCLYLFGFGWGRQIPIDPSAITWPRRWLKITTAYLSYAAAHIAIATVAMTLLLILFGFMVVPLSADMMLTGYLSQQRFALAYPESSSVVISLALILIKVIYLNLFLAVFDFFFRGFELMVMYAREYYPQYVAHQHNALIFLLYAIIISIFVIPYIRLILVALVAQWGYILAHIFGAL